MAELPRTIDCDIHHHYTQATLAKYLPERAADHSFPSGRALPHPDGAHRTDTYPETGGPPAGSPEAVAEELLDPNNTAYGILNCGGILGLPGIRDVDRAAEVARAINDWTIAEWFPADERYLGSIVVSPSDPAQAAAEIRRLSSTPRMVSVVTTGWEKLMGSSFYDPIYEACAETGLPLAFHQSGLQVTPGNTPTTFPEMHLGMCIPGIPHVVSTLTQGVFVKFPSLRIVMMEFGIGWIPWVMWRLDWEYRAGRDEMPWLTKPPSEYMTENMRFTTQPLEEPNHPRDLRTLLSLFDAKNMLMFSSDYPHWDAENPHAILQTFPDDWRQRIYFDNANELFRLEERLGRTLEPAGVA